MKTYQEIERELKEIQESWRHPKPETPQSLAPMPKPEGEIAAISVQFLLKELEREIELRDHAGGAVVRLQKELEEALAACERADKARATAVHALEVLERPAKALADAHESPVPRQIYEDALNTITRWRGEAGESEAKIEELEKKLVKQSGYIRGVEDGYAHKVASLLQQVSHFEALVADQSKEVESLYQELSEKALKIGHMRKEEADGPDESEEARRRFIAKYMPFAAARIKELSIQVKSRDEYITEVESDRDDLAVRARSEKELAARLGSRLTAESKLVDSLNQLVGVQRREIAELKEQARVNRIAALAMYQKLQAASVMARSGSDTKAAKYLQDSVNFFFSAAIREVKELNADERQDENPDDEHITDAEEPRHTG